MDAANYTIGAKAEYTLLDIAKHPFGTQYAIRLWIVYSVLSILLSACSTFAPPPPPPPRPPPPPSPSPPPANRRRSRPPRALPCGRRWRRPALPWPHSTN